MTHSDFRRQLQAALQADAPQGDAKQRTLEAVTAQMQAAASRPRLGFAAFLRTQVRFIGWKIWLFQAICLLVANGALDTVFGGYYFFNSRPAALCLGALAMLVLLTALPVVYNASLYHMQEMEAASYFSSQRLLAAHAAVSADAAFVPTAAVSFGSRRLSDLDGPLPAAASLPGRRRLVWTGVFGVIYDQQPLDPAHPDAGGMDRRPGLYRALPLLLLGTALSFAQQRLC